MNRLILYALFLLVSLNSIHSQPIENVQFKDLSGKSYDLHRVLESGKHVFCHFTRSG